MEKIISDSVDIANRMSDQLTKEMNKSLKEGFVVFHSWDPPLRAGDTTRVFGMITMVKRGES